MPRTVKTELRGTVFFLSVGVIGSSYQRSCQFDGDRHFGSIAHRRRLLPGVERYGCTATDPAPPFLVDDRGR